MGSKKTQEKTPAYVMTDEQKRLFDALTPLQQKVCTNIISGMSNIDAYMEANKKIKNKATGEANVSRMLSHAKVGVFLDSMKAAKVSDAIMSRDEMLEIRTRMARLDISELSKLSLEELTEVKGGVDLKLKAINDSMKQIADIAGYNAAVKTEAKVVSMDIAEDTTPQDAANAYKTLMGM